MLQPILRWTCALVALGLGSLASAQAPKLVRILPEPGRGDVPPGPQELVIEFDRPMGPHVALSMIDAPFPEVAGEPRWEEERTLIVPITLEPGQRYGFGINSVGHTGFRSKEGVRAETLLVRFTTAGGMELDEGMNAEALRRLRAALEHDYSYRALHGVSAELPLDEEALLAARRPFAFAEILARGLALIPDPHLWLEAGKAQVACFQRSYESNISVQVTANLLGNWNSLTSNCASAVAEGDIGYLLLATLADGASVEAALHSLQGAPHRAWILDLRNNGGGDEVLARKLAGLFVSEPVLYAKHRFLDASAPHGLGTLHERILEPVTPGERISVPLAVLMGPGCLSSTEALLLMLAQAPDATLYGTPSGGSSGNPLPHDLGNGVTIHLPSWIAMDAQGEPFEVRGIPPDIFVPCSPEDLAAGRDPVLARALEDLRD